MADLNELEALFSSRQITIRYLFGIHCEAERWQESPIQELVR